MSHRGPSPWFVGRALMRCPACGIDQEMDASEVADTILCCRECGGEMMTVELRALVDPAREKRK